MKKYSVERIEYKDAKPWIMDIHYAHRMPSISFAYGLFLDRNLSGIISYGSPASPWLCKGICGVEYKSLVIELNRLVLLENRKNEASMLISKSLRLLPKPKIIVSYADVAQNHIGYVYQATNWLYTGATKPRTDMYSESGHSRHHAGDRSKRVYRSSKHRYVYFIGSKKQRKELLKALKYKTEQYPKTINEPDAKSK